MLLDEILTEIGEFGAYQIWLYMLLGLTGIPTGCQNMGITFIGGDMDHFCEVPRLQNYSYEQQKYIAIPYDSDNEDYNQCEYYDLPWDNYSDAELQTWNRTATEGVSTTSCNSWNYDQSVFISTVVSSMNLVCDKKSLVSLIQTIYMTGFLTGCVVFGQLSDRYGRKKALLISLTIEAVFALSSSFLDNFAAFTSCRFFVGMGAGGSFTTIFVMSMEIIGGKWRTPTGILIQAWFSLGIMISSFIAGFIRDHKVFQGVLATIPILLLSYAYVLTESPRWLISEGRYEEATKILEHIATVNRRKLPENLDLSSVERGKKVEKADERKPILIDLLKTPNLRKITLNMWFAWFVTSLAYYGLSLGVDVLGGSLFVNSFIAGFLEVPAMFIVIIFLDRVGRRWPTIITFLLSGLCCLLCTPFLASGPDAALSTFLMLGKAILAALFAIVYVYAAELFPTVVRNVGVGSSSMSARVGGLLQPQISLLSDLWAPAPFTIYGVLSLIACFTSYFLPETLGKKLPDTMEEGEQFGKKISAVGAVEMEKAATASSVDEHHNPAVKEDGLEEDNNGMESSKI